MATIILRAVKGSPLLNSEVDANFTNLNTEKIERDGSVPMTKRLSLAAAAAISDGASLYIPSSGATPTSLANGDLWNDTGVLKFYDGSVTADILTSAVDTLSLDGNFTALGNVILGDTATSVTINADVVEMKDNNLTLGKVAIPTNVTADGGGFTIKGATDKTFSWSNANAAWQSSESLSLLAGKTFQINNVSVLSATTLGTSVVNSSLTSLGTIASLVATAAQITRLGVGMAASGTAGRIDAANDIVAYSSSDVRLKKDITTIENALESVKQIRGVRFTWDEALFDAHGYAGPDTGVIAQEVEGVLPEVVTVRENGFMAVKYEKMIGLLIEAIKELDAKVSTCTCKKA